MTMSGPWVRGGGGGAGEYLVNGKIPRTRRCQNVAQVSSLSKGDFSCEHGFRV